MTSTISTIEKNIAAIKSKIDSCIEKCGREKDSVKLMAVSKFHSAEEIEQAINCGIKLFGENRVQESCSKFPQLIEKHPDISLHLIGQLQRNKVKQILPLVSAIQSVDRIELIDEIEKQAAKINLAKKIDLFLEYHTGEESKSGFLNEDEVFFALEKIASSNFVRAVGFMTMAPFTDDKETVRNSFKKLKALQQKAKLKFPELNLEELSMGMSNDFEIAIEEGATLVRVGTAIFGERNYGVKIN